jgi:general stress protein YciG
MNKREAGKLGGLATFKKHGRTHMQDIGTKGAQTTWTRYSKAPYGLTQYALVERATNKIIRILNG